jgi:V/A-type H+-transporting ATPase subunit A
MSGELDGGTGQLTRIAGPVVVATGLRDVRLYDVVQVGELKLIGEVIRLAGELATIQVYEDTSGVRIGEPVYTSGLPLVAELGPGLLGRVYDGLQRPLADLVTATGNFVERGVAAPALPPDVRWAFSPCVSAGEHVHPGDILGVVPESQSIEHRVLVPPNFSGRLVEVHEGEFLANEVVAILELDDNKRTHRAISLIQQWPIRHPRPVQQRLVTREPLMTGTRVIDAFFPVAKGGAGIIPGGFGTGKTLLQHSLASWSNVDVVVYVGCGERGNEMTEVLEEFPTLEDPRTGAPLMARTVLIANTSNMPVAAREASIYMGITIAEYYRDMGYDVLMLADSTSRWGEALREISGRLEEMPGQEGYPAYLATRLSEFYERSGRVSCLGGTAAEPRAGSVTIVGAVSPPGGDLSEPITQNSMRVVGVFWGLDYDLSRRRHFPAINWIHSYSLYHFQDWYQSQNISDWDMLTHEAMALLQREAELLQIVELVGPDALSKTERLVLFIARILREDFLHQLMFDEVDRFCPLVKTSWMLRAIMAFYQQAQEAMERGIALEQIMSAPVVKEIARMKESSTEEAPTKIKILVSHVESTFLQSG